MSSSHKKKNNDEINNMKTRRQTKTQIRSEECLLVHASQVCMGARTFHSADVSRESPPYFVCPCKGSVPYAELVLVELPLQVAD